MDITKPLNVAFESLATKASTREEIIAILQQQFPATVVEKTLEHLQELNMIGDHAVVNRILKRYPDRGNQWQLMKCRQKGIQEDLALQCIEQQPSEFDRAYAAAQQKNKFITDDPDRSKRIAKIVRFLAGRGFPEEICQQVSSQLFENTMESSL